MAHLVGGRSSGRWWQFCTVTAGGNHVAEVLRQFTDPVTGHDGESFIARACGAIAPDGMWHGWIEVVPVSGEAPLRSGPETTQPNRQDALYWPGGRTPVHPQG